LDCHFVRDNCVQRSSKSSYRSLRHTSPLNYVTLHDGNSSLFLYHIESLAFYSPTSKRTMKYNRGRNSTLGLRLI